MPPRPPRQVRLVAPALLACLSGSAHAQTLLFSDRTAAAGLSCAHVKDPASDPQVMAAGGVAADFDRDGWQDLFVLGGFGNPDRLFINNRDGTFTDRAAQWGVARVHRGLGVAVGDYDRDGLLDLYLTTEPGAGGAGLNALYRNTGAGFVDSAGAAGVATAPGSTLGGGWGAAFGDYDLDGRLDLAVANWINPATGNRLYRGQPNGTFADVTTAAVGAALVGSQGFSPRFCDMDGDRHPELLWTSDFGRSRYLVNNRDGTFTDRTAAAGVGLDGNGMGTSVGDFNADGRPDWFVTSIYTPNATPNQPGTGNMLYTNLGAHAFAETSAAAGVKQGGWGWGSVAADLDNDGREDLAHTNGWPEPEFAADQTCVFARTAPNTFVQLAPACGVTHTGQGRGMLNFDADNDGDQDLVVFTNDGPLAYYRNELAGGSAHFLRLFFSTRGDPDLAPDGYGVHARVTVAGIAQHRWLTGGSNFLSQSELSVHFGLGAADRVDELRVDWPDGTHSVWSNVAADRALTLRSCPGDFGDDGTVSVADIFGFLAAWFAHAPAADHDLSGATTVSDIFSYLSDWFAGC